MAVSILGAEVTPQNTTVGQPVTVDIWAEDTTWERVANTFTNWNDVYNSFSNWQAVVNWTFSHSGLYDADSLAVYDSDSERVYAVHVGSGNISQCQYYCSDIDSFIQAVE